MCKQNVNGIELAMAKVNTLATTIHNAKKEMEELAIGLINDCGGEFKFDDTTSYPYFKDDAEDVDEAICSVKVINGALNISVSIEPEYFPHDKYGVTDVENICRIILATLAE
jgi:hypothetical protein